MSELKPNPYFKSLADAHTIVPFNRKWKAYKKLNRVSQYLYEEFQKESWFMR